MSKFLLLAIVLLGPAQMLYSADWASQSGNPQRDGWARDETEITKNTVPRLCLLYKRTLDNRSNGLNALSSPIILGNLITYLGFKEMLFTGGSSNMVYSIDAALNRLLWETHFDVKGDDTHAQPTDMCPSGMTATPAILGGSGETMSFHMFRRGPRPASPGGVFSTGFGRNGYVFAIGSDGYLRFVRQSDGDVHAVQPVKFLPPNAKATAINIKGTTVYAATVEGCGGNPNALYAVDLGGSERNVVSFSTNGSGLAGLGGTAIGANGKVFAQVASGHSEVAGDYHDTVVALNPSTLKVEDYFTPLGSHPSDSASGVTPAVFPWKDKELIVAADGHKFVALLDSASLGGPDHHTPLALDESMAYRGVTGDFATWEDPSNSRWIYAAIKNESEHKGGIIGIKVQDQNGKPTLIHQWTSINLINPAPPIVANGVVFALSAGDQSHKAAIYALDAATGKVLFATGNEITSFSHNSGLALANGRVYFTTHDNTIYCYGLPDREPQLKEY